MSAMLLLESRGAGWKRQPDTRTRARERSPSWEYTRDVTSRKAYAASIGLRHSPHCKALARILRRPA